MYALKKIFFEKPDMPKDGFPITAMREIRIFKKLEHENIVKMYGVTFTKGHKGNKKRGSCYMIFEYVKHDLQGLVDSKSVKF